MYNKIKKIDNLSPPRSVLSIYQKGDFMIIQNKFIFNSFKEFLIDSFILSTKKLENRINEIYGEAINSIDFNKVVCHKCRAIGNYEIKGYYHRYIIINNYKLKINILRIKCKNCGRTHAILFLDFVPYYQLSAKDSKVIIENDFKDEYYDTELINHLRKRVKEFNNRIKPYGLNVFKDAILVITRTVVLNCYNSYLQIHRGIVLLNYVDSP